MKLNLEGRLAWLLLALLLVAGAGGAALDRALTNPILATALLVTAGAFPTVWLARKIVRPLQKVLRGVSATVANYSDGDYSASLTVDREDELGELLAVHNKLADALREQRSHLVQRELLLETVTQNSPVALVTVDAYQRVAYANLAARNLLSEGRSLAGENFAQVLERTAEPLRHAVTNSTSEDCLFSIAMNDVEETFHLSRRSFYLQGQPHELYLFKRLTRELSRCEVATWKKLIRILSHELNNSLAPIASLAHTGTQLTRRGEVTELPAVLAAIGERADHLHRFLLSYANLAKLPAPRPEWTDWEGLFKEIARYQRFRLDGTLPTRGWFDRSQITQALINLLKNAHEAGGLDDDVEVAVLEGMQEYRVEVRDRGPGMSETVMSQALLPFYSTKREGTGLGLALVREIAEAHSGHIRLSNREGGGFCASLILPTPHDTSSSHRQSPKPDRDNYSNATMELAS